MENISDVDAKHDRTNHYDHPPFNPVHQLPPTETSTLHQYPPRPGPTMPPPAQAWNPAPSPYVESPDPRVHHHDMAHQQHYPPPPPPPPPPPHPASQPYQPPPTRESQPYPPPPEPYGRPGSVSGPTRSPAESQHPSYHSTPHEPSYYPPTPGDYRARHSYPGPDSQSNGSHQPPLHVVTGHDMMQAQSPAQAPPYGHPHSAGPQPQSSYPYYAHPDYAAGQRRKPVRATQACDSCRQRKAKCDEGRPVCQHCKDNNLKCFYRDIPPQKSEKQALAITAQLEAIAAQLEANSNNIKILMDLQNAQGKKIEELWQERHRTVQDPSYATHQSTPNEQKDIFPAEKPTLMTQSSQSSLRREGTLDMPQPGPSQQPSSEQPSRTGHASGRATHHSNQGAPLTTSAPKARSAEPEMFELSLPVKHTTAAQNLVLWPSIRRLIPAGITPSYVKDSEIERGLLRLYGCGEGDDKGDGREAAASPAGSASSEGRRLDDDSAGSPHGVWGNGSLYTPAGLNPSSHHPAREHPGGISPLGGLMLETDAIDRYFRSYMDNIHILHPFLESKVLRAMIHTFKKTYSWDYRPTQTIIGAGVKRKRETDSPGGLEEQNGTTQQLRGHARPGHLASPPIEHSIGNAIVLLVIALGKVTSHRDPLPGVPSSSFLRTSTPHSAMYSDLPMAPTSAPPSPFNNQIHLNGGHQIHISSPANPQGKNIDTVPGLAYFTKAADIIGEQTGGTGLAHVQANLLAGLYMGQLARIVPSYHYIHNACIAVQVLIDSTEYVEGNMNMSTRNLINFAFWSCLQLESDIAAEMDLPPSGITRYESAQHKEMPTEFTLERGFNKSGNGDLLRFYSYQIQLRVTINSIHSTLYRVSKNPETRSSDTMMSILDENLENWRDMLNDWNWSDDDHESPDINVARIRGKYYGAKYIIWRPALHHALLQVGEGSVKGSRSESPSDYEVSLGKTVPYLSEAQLRGAKICVNAAVRSTTCFDKVPRRWIVTNIFGTAHAQFGNMLVLYAAYTAPHPALSSLIDRDTLLRLHNRTISILKENEAISPILAKDLKILEHVRNRVFSYMTSNPSASQSSSFSSRV
ncbi:hypothetical protein PV10_05308 [Exophiala mesophila]|uniref:Zn(2)-C6 fungal-type domain-containing protein n=1 Tax=Exophiala mesophila TaxID=212818 RepID=A0A0D1Z9I3_EXOME|nr:uncharacterized protein PV10_05308 [Exophiala mesophila]KIV90679.1 hypothetical protein PV10_05308 [Exophiala mesophila]